MWPHDDDEFGEVQGDLVDVGNRPAGLRGAQRPGVADLGAERHAELDALGEQRVVAAVGGRRPPQPRHDRSPMKPSSRTRRRSSRTATIGRSRSTEARPANRAGCCRTHSATSSLETRSCRWAAPRRQQADVDPGGVHRGDGRRRSGSRRRGSAAPVQRCSEANMSVARKRASGAASRRRSSSRSTVDAGQCSTTRNWSGAIL